MTPLPPHTIRESTRARHVNLKISTDGELEVVIPRGFDRKQIPDILRRKETWIKRATKRATERSQVINAQPSRPVDINFLAVNKTWAVEYKVVSSRSITVAEKSEQQILLSGPVDDLEFCKFALRQWAKGKARQYLEPWLAQVSKEEKLPYKTVTVRGQKTRWGSCSSRKTISLNYKLLFLPPPMVRYVLVHELCHTKQLNHSPKFWALVEAIEPNYKQIKKELRASWRYLPGWVQK